MGTHAHAHVRERRGMGTCVRRRWEGVGVGVMGEADPLNWAAEPRSAHLGCTRLHRLLKAQSG